MTEDQQQVLDALAALRKEVELLAPKALEVVKERDELREENAALKIQNDRLTEEFIGICRANAEVGEKAVEMIAELAELKLQANHFLLWFNSDGSPCTGFRFNEERNKLAKLVEHREWYRGLIEGNDLSFAKTWLDAISTEETC